jgi:hypothetical protein
VILGRTLRAPQVKRVDRASKSKVAHVEHVTHRDEVEAPITEWLREAYEYSGAAAKTRAPAKAPIGAAGKAKASARKSRTAQPQTAAARRPRK